MDSDNTPPTHFFKSGKGTIKVGKKEKDRIEFIPAVERVKTYEDMFNIVQQHGTLAAAVLVGFNEAGYGDQHPIREISYSETIGKPYLDWLNRIAAIDGKIKKYFEDAGARFSTNKAGLIPPYDFWITSGCVETDDYECDFRRSPFLASFLETAIMGVVRLPYPMIDNIRWSSSIRLLLEKHCGNPRLPVQDKAMLAKIVGKDDAVWLGDNLALDI